MKVYPDGYIDLEFGPFLFADSIYMDILSYDHLVRKPPRTLSRAAESLRILEGEGYLKLIDYTDALASRSVAIVSATDRKVANPYVVRNALESAILTWDGIAPLYAKLLRRDLDPKALLSIGVLAGLKKDGKSQTFENAELVRRVALSPDGHTRGQMELLGEICRPYLDHVHTNIALSKALGAAIVDWEDVGPMYKNVLFENLDEDKAFSSYIPKVRELFSVYLTALEPSSVFEFLSTVRDGRIGNFRNFIIDAAEGRVEFNQDMAQLFLLEATRGAHSSGRVGATLNVVSAVVGAGAALFDLGLTAAIATAVGASIGQQAISSGVSDLANRNMGWILCLVDAKNNNRGKK